LLETFNVASALIALDYDWEKIVFGKDERGKRSRNSAVLEMDVSG
jgi:hypothetical protein